MRDGTVLRTDVYTPDGGGPFPTLLRRTPYDKLRDLTVEQATEFVQSGYAVVAQDVRGRYASGGELKMGFFSSDVHDAEDGYDTVEWGGRTVVVQRARRDVGQFVRRLDAVGVCAHAAATPRHYGPRHDRRQPARTRTVRSAASRPRPDLVRHQPERRHPHPFRPAPEWRDRDEAPREFVEKDRSKWLWYLPLADIPVEALAGTRDLWRKWLADHATDHFRFEQTHHETDVPVLSITGWYDQQIGTIKHFTGMLANGMTEHARNNQRLIIGPWTHGYHLSGVVGEVDFGPEAAGDYVKICVDWFDRWLKDDTEGAAAGLASHSAIRHGRKPVAGGTGMAARPD